MAVQAEVVVRVRAESAKTIRALEVVGEVMGSIAEDFDYREDVKRGIKAMNYLLNHLVVAASTEVI